jgi:glycerol-3-phosphate dehydrogenase
MSRHDVFNLLRQQPEFSVLIIGGGVNGIGTFRDLALQGVDVLLIDKGDFCSGASAASSHMLHGGIRYLENGEFRLVREALTERNRMLHNAPHYAKPLSTTIPIYSWFSGIFNAPLKFLNLRDKPSERGALVIKIGLILYDWFTRRQQGLPGHRLVSRAESIRRRPKLNRDILCTATYYDAWMPHPERICVEMLLDAEIANPKAHGMNYVSLDSVSGDRVILKDEVTGEQYLVKPRIVINAAGPWIDLTNGALGQKTRFIGGTRGSHLIVDHPELHHELHGNELFFENKDGRICLIFPLFDKVIIGTTDIREDNPEAVCTEDEVDYMLELVSYVFPAIKIDRSHIVFRFCGVRPLPASGASRTGAISRDHSIQIIEPNQNIKFPVLSLVGGKWTTFRAFSEQASDEVLRRLGKARQVSTKNLPIGGGNQYPMLASEQSQWLSSVALQTGLSLERVRILFERYGTRAREVAEYLQAGEDGPLHNQPDYSRREIAFLAVTEKVMHLDDIIIRRSLLGMLGQVSGGLIVEIASIVAGAMNWPSQTIDQEIQRTVDLLRARHSVSDERLQYRIATTD